MTPIRLVTDDARTPCNAETQSAEAGAVNTEASRMQQADTRQKIDQIANTTISRRRAVQGAAALGLAGPALSLGLAGQAAAQDAPVLRLGTNAADIQSLDPHLASGTQDRTIVDMIFSALVRYKPGTVSELEPDIAAEMPTAVDNDDGTQTWTVKLRDDVMVHASETAGTEAYALTSADVVFSLEKAANPDSSSYSANYPGWSLEAIDDQTVEITLESPLSETLFLPNIANYSGGFIIPQQPFEALGADGFVSNPVGTGPFAFESYTPQNSVVLTANADFYRGAPQLGGVEVRFIADATSRELGLQSGDLDVISGLPEARWVDSMNQNEGFVAEVFGVGESIFLNINTEMEPFNDPAVREAVVKAISRESHVALFGEPVGEATYSIVPGQQTPGGLTEEEATEAGVNFEQDIEGATQLLTDAGFGDGLEINLVSSEMEDYRRAYEVLAEELRQIGITVNLEVVQHAAMHELIRQDENALTVYVAFRPNAHVYLSQFFTAGTEDSPNVTNFSKFDVSDLVDQAITAEPDEQAELWRQANIAILENFAGFGLVLKNLVYARSEAVDYGHELEAVINLYPGIDETTSITS
jgi:peptide/nickel transport system substrate-binding protein